MDALSLDGDASEKQLELPLQGPFADAVTISKPGGTLSTPAAAILVLSSPGLLHMYDGVGMISHFFTPSAEDSVKQAYLQPLPWQAPLKDAAFSRLFLVSPDSLTARVLLQSSQGIKDPLPTLAAGTKWPVSGGAQFTSNDSTKGRLFLVTGRKCGGIQVWDISSPSIELLCTVKAQTNKDPAPVSSVVLNDQSGLLAYGDQEGKVYVFKLSTEAQEVSCKIISDSFACSARGTAAPSKGGMQLGKSIKTNPFLESLRAEGEVIMEDEKLGPIRAAAAALIMVGVEEKLVAVLKDGGLENLEVQGNISLVRAQFVCAFLPF